MKFQEKLYQLRKERKLSQEDLAEKIGVTRQAVQKWESGASTPDMNNLLMISDYFGVTLDQLIRDEQNITLGDEEITTDIPKKNGIYVINNYHYRPNYEYISKRKIFGIPLVHVNIGNGIRVAKGIIAIGNLSIGLLSIGGISLGLFSIGGVALGLLALAGLGIGGIAAGGAALGYLAFGGFAFGTYAIGGIAVGTYCAGGIAVASKVAMGGVANGYYAIGDEVSGTLTITKSQLSGASLESIQNDILEKYPRIMKWFLHLLKYFLR